MCAEHKSVTPTIAEDEQEKKAFQFFHKAVACHQQNQLDKALSLYRQAISLKPDYADAYNNMAVALRKLNHYEAALSCYQRSLAIRPNHAGTYSNMGNVLNDLDRLTPSIRAHYKAIELEPHNLLYLYNAALVLRDGAKYEDAISLFNQILDKDPEYKDCRWDRSLTYLMSGQLRAGFQEYDSRWLLAKNPPRAFKQPRWQGDNLNGRTLFIHREQGFGDAIQFARFIPEIKKRFGGKIILECQPELLRLFSTLDDVDLLVPYGKKPPAFDCWIPLLSLGEIFQLDEKSIPNTTPYLSAPKPNRFKLHTKKGNTLNVGIVWAGSPTHQNDRRRSCDVSHFLPFTHSPKVTLFSLQKGHAAEDLKTCGANYLIIDIANEFNDFADSAQFIEQLDLVITIDTSVAHLSAALNIETWVLLPYTADWRWMHGREDSPWYPSMTLFRQPTPSDWEGCFKKVELALREKLSFLD